MFHSSSIHKLKNFIFHYRFTYTPSLQKKKCHVLYFDRFSYLEILAIKPDQIDMAVLF